MTVARHHLEETSLPARLGLAVSVGYPWLWLVSVYITWLVARVSLGRYPRPLLDDPNNIVGAVSTMHAISVALLVPLLPLGCASVVVGVWLGASRRLHWNAVGTWLSALVVSWLFAIIYARADPGGVLAWFLD